MHLERPGVVPVRPRYHLSKGEFFNKWTIQEAPSLRGERFLMPLDSGIDSRVYN